ncbi:TetR/AcrR family transcriptional regulator [Saccharopolyspora dendranthemae]|uniref:TetR/AcrR family transcriptional regulator n=1 Tax=Saccharopolyspora dendranthemae TaxID=1181886 RepID=UPI001649570E|nr:TetR/AcrR family transcriptional regulator [Saccharopolyspora dendranthemae]
MTTTRSSGRAEQPHRARIAEAARELAAERGYTATTLREVAARAGTTPATVYHHFGSKDGLLHHVMVDWALRTHDDLRARRYTGSSAERVAAAFGDVVRWAADDADLLAAGMRSFHSSDAAGAGMATWHALFLALVRAALGDETWDDARGQAMTLGHVLVSCLLDLTSGRADVERARRHITTAAELLFR